MNEENKRDTDEQRKHARGPTMHDKDPGTVIGQDIVAILTKSRLIKIIAKNPISDWLYVMDRVMFVDKNVMSAVQKYMQRSSQTDSNFWEIIHTLSACCILNHSDLGTIIIDAGPALLEEPKDSYRRKEREAMSIFVNLSHDTHREIIRSNIHCNVHLPIEPQDYNLSLNRDDVIKPYYYLILAGYVCMRKKSEPIEQIQEYLAWQRENTIDLLAFIMVNETIAPRDARPVLKNRNGATFEKLKEAALNAAFDCYLVHGVKIVAKHEPKVGIAICSADDGVLSALTAYQYITRSPGRGNLIPYLCKKWGGDYTKILPFVEDIFEKTSLHTVPKPNWNDHIEKEIASLEKILKKLLGNVIDN